MSNSLETELGFRPNSGEKTSTVNIAGIRWRTLSRQTGFPLLLYIVATLATSANFAGDTVDYAKSVEDVVLHGTGTSFWDFGHLLWRPLGLVLYRILHPVSRLAFGDDVARNVIGYFVALNWLTGLGCVLLLYGVLVRLGFSRRVSGVAVSGFVFSHAFLNYFHTGASYVPGLLGILLAMYALSREQTENLPVTSLIAAAGLGLSLCCWATYIAAVPGVLLFPLIAFGMDKRRIRLVVQTAALGAVLTVIVFGTVAFSLHLRTIPEIGGWIASAAHEQAHLGSEIYTYATRDDGRGADYPHITAPSAGFDESNLSQDGRVYLTYHNRPSWGDSLDFRQPLEFREPAWPQYQQKGKRIYWAAHGHMGFFLGSNGRSYVVKSLTDLIDNKGNGIIDQVGQIGTVINGQWRAYQILANTATGKVELLWGEDAPEKGWGLTGHISRSQANDVFWASSEQEITRFEVSYDNAGKPARVSGENIAKARSGGCGYWSSPRVASDPTGQRAMFDSVLAGECKSQVYVVVKRSAS